MLPLSHIIQDSYFKPELEAILNLFWPLPTPEGMTELQPLIKDRVAYVMERQAVSKPSYPIRQTTHERTLQHAALLHAWDGVLGAAPDHAEVLEAYAE